MRASTHWRRLVRARLAEQEQLSAGSGTLGATYWDARARRYASRVAGSAERDPLLARMRQAAAAEGATVLDVGAGPGRFSLAVAPHVASVTAVDPSREMLAILRRDARRAGLTNVSVVHSTWEAAGPLSADVVICAHVLPVIANASSFLAKLDASCTGRAFVSMAAMPVEALVDHLWRHFHGRPRRPGPTYLDAVAVLEELGIDAGVEVVEVPTLARFSGLAEAVRSSREMLLLPDTAEVREELRALLGSWLVADGEGVRVPLPVTPAAIVSWAGGHGGRQRAQDGQRRRPGR